METEHSVPRTRRGSLLDRLFMNLEKRRPSDNLTLKIVAIALFVSVIWGLIVWSESSATPVPSTGGSLVEGIVGTPRFLNPVLAVTRADKDMTALIYAGLIKLGADGSLVNDVAESITVSDDGLTYNVVLKQNVVFHDDATLTASDVVFTIGRIQDPALQSPRRASFEGVTVEELGEHEVNFILEEPYAPFIENLTVGILPHHIWKDLSNEEFPFSQHNSEPIGAGPYKEKKIVRTTSGIPSSYILEPHTTYHGQVPRIGELTFTFYPHEEALVEDLRAGLIESSAGLSIEAIEALDLPDTHEVITAPLPRTFALFFNQNKSAALREEAVRKALDTAIDRDTLIQEVLMGYAQPLYSPIPPGFGINTDTYVPEYASSTPFDTAREILRNDGWEIDGETGIWSKEIDEVDTPLAFSIATVNNPVFEATAEHLRAAWEKLGAQVTIKQFEQSDLTQAIIRPRDYEALLFGTDVGRPLDFYSFWHSSQRNDPGLNVALYANITTDSILTEARTNASSTEQEVALNRFTEEILSETPAVFLYSPELLYVLPKEITGESFSKLAESHERFSNIEEWFVDSESIWPVFQE